jgi:hypothetical protein
MMDLVTIESCAGFSAPVSLAEFDWRNLDRIREHHAIGHVEALDGGRDWDHPSGVASPVDPLRLVVDVRFYRLRARRLEEKWPRPPRTRDLAVAPE